MLATPSGHRVPQILDQIDRAVPRDLTVHLVLDNYATHKTKEIRAWFLRHPRYQLHFTPTHSSWLNQVERWFALLSQRQIKRGSHYSVRELESAILEFITIHNERPKPFVWTKSAEAILTALAGSLPARLPYMAQTICKKSMTQETSVSSSLAFDCGSSGFTYTPGGPQNKVGASRHRCLSHQNYAI